MWDMGRLQIADRARKCRQCGKPLQRKRFKGRLEDRSNFRRRLFCDRLCMASFQLSSSPSSHFLKRFRKKRCEQCSSERSLGVHHADEDRNNNQPENLVTLCATCHTLLHWQNGKRRAPLCYVCGKPSIGWGLCGMHRTRLKRYGSPYLRPKKTGHRSQLYWDLSIPNGLRFPVLLKE